MRDLGSLLRARSLRGAGYGCLSMAIALPIVGFFFWLISCLPASVPINGGEPPDSLPRILIVTVSVILCTAVPVVIGILVISRQAAKLDAIFLTLGFTGRWFMLTGRAYYRNIGEREINIFIFKGPTLDIRMSIPINAQMRVFRRNSIPAQMAGRLNTPAFLPQIPDLVELAFYPADALWLGEFLEGIQAAKAIHSLMLDGADWAIFRQVELLPGELNLHLYETKEMNAWPLDQAVVSNWIASMETLADELLKAGLPAFQISENDRSIQPGMPMGRSITRWVLLVTIISSLACTILSILIMFLAYNG